MKRVQIDQFEKIQTQSRVLYEEIGALSKKAPNDAVNKFKLKFINQTLQVANMLLGDEYKPFREFELFDDEADLPTNSDVSMILAQYLGCLEKLRADNIQYDTMRGGWFWSIDGEKSDIKTVEPNKLRR